jgi:hypothetical protein
MKISFFVFFLLNALNMFGQSEQTINYKDDKFKIGQVWKYYTPRIGEENSTFTILKIEKSKQGQILLHIYIDGLKIRNSKNPKGYDEEIRHIVFEKEALIETGIELKYSTAKIPNFKKDYKKWKKDRIIYFQYCL